MKTEDMVSGGLLRHEAEYGLEEMDNSPIRAIVPPMESVGVHLKVGALKIVTREDAAFRTIT